jgi:hypothetical protein
MKMAIKTEPRIKTNDAVEKLPEEKKDDLFTDLIMGKDATDEIQTSRGMFKIKYPRASDILTIGKLSAARRNYRPVESFDAETELVNVMASTLDVVVVSGPSWYEGAKTANPNFSFLEVPSQAFLAELYRKAYSFRGEVEQRFDKAERPAGKRVPAEKGDDDPVDGGAFGTLTNEQDDKGT